MCWQGLADNPWFVGASLQRFCPPTLPPARARMPTLPFTLGDPEHTARVLAAAGWSAIERAPYRQTVTVEPEVLVDDDVYLRYLGVADDRLAEARAVCEGHLAPLRRSDGRYDAPLAFHVFTARN